MMTLIRRLLDASGALLAPAFLALTVPASAQVVNTDKVLSLLDHSHPDLVMVAAHRGVWGMRQRIPENSLRAIDQAIAARFPMVEIDLKMMKDGTIIAMHDFNLGRTTDIGRYCSQITQSWNGCNGNALYDSRSNTGFNPKVSDISLSTLTKFGVKLRLADGSVSTDSRDGPPTLEHIMSRLAESRGAIVLLLDVKDRATAVAAKNIIARYKNSFGNPAHNWVVFKMNALTYPDPAMFEHDFGTAPYKFIPVFTTNMVGRSNCCLAIFNAYRPKGYVWTYEVNVKTPGGALTDVLSQVKRYSHSPMIFNAVPDAGGNQFYKNTGQCCYTLADIYQPGEHEDRRGNLDFLVSEGMKAITTDDVDATTTYLYGRRLYNTSLYMDR